MSTVKAYVPETQAHDENFDTYLNILQMVERLHRSLLDIIKFELDKHEYTDINSVQALLIFNMGNAKLSAGELRGRGYYMGTNVSYNLKKLVDSGYVNHSRSDKDKRSVRVQLTEKGMKVHDIVDTLYNKHANVIEKVGDIKISSMSSMRETLEKLERFWQDQIRYRL